MQLKLAVAIVLAGALAGALPAQITFHDPAGEELVAADAVVEKLGGGMKFVEGPVWLPKEQALVFSDIPRGKLLRWTAEDGVTEWRDCANANGNTLDLQGRLISCQHGARNVVRYEAGAVGEPGAMGEPTVLVDRFEGRRFHSPNDVAVRADGTIWFTDPTYGLAGREREQEGNFVYRLDPTSGELTVVQGEFDMPNGICFSPDHERIYIADSGRKQRVGAFRVESAGPLSKALFWLEGGADGLRCDAVGNLYTTARDGVRVYSPAGEHLVTIALPEVPSNCAFGGAQSKTLFVTARTSLYRVELEVPGAPVPPAAARREPPGDGGPDRRR